MYDVWQPFCGVTYRSGNGFGRLITDYYIQLKMIGWLSILLESPIKRMYTGDDCAALFSGRAAGVGSAGGRGGGGGGGFGNGRRD